MVLRKRGIGLDQCDLAHLFILCYLYLDCKQTFSIVDAFLSESPLTLALS